MPMRKVKADKKSVAGTVKSQRDRKEDLLLSNEPSTPANAKRRVAQAERQAKAEKKKKKKKKK